MCKDVKEPLFLVFPDSLNGQPRFIRKEQTRKNQNEWQVYLGFKGGSKDDKKTKNMKERRNSENEEDIFLR